MTNDVVLMMQLASAGVRLTMGLEEIVRPSIDRRELVPVLEEFSTPFPGFYLYYPQRRQAPPAFRTLVDFLLRMRRDTSSVSANAAPMVDA